MLLTVDVGNTETTVGAFDGATLAHHWRLATVPTRTADEQALLFAGLLDRAGLAFWPGSPGAPLTGMSISSVVPALTPTLRDLAVRHLGLEPVVVGPGVRTGLRIRTEDPREVGADRVANAVAVLALYTGPAVVVDFGTATTFDALSADGELLGSAIAPGIQVSLGALTERAAQLRRVELRPPRSVIGRSTVEALRSGVVFGTAGQVDGMVRRIAAELGGDPVVMATGGLAEVVLAACETVHQHEPWLTLHGLRLVHDRVAGRESS